MSSASQTGVPHGLSAHCTTSWGCFQCATSSSATHYIWTHLHKCVFRCCGVVGHHIPCKSYDMMRSYRVSTQSIAFLYYYGVGGVLFLLVFRLRIPLSHVIVIPLPSVPLYIVGGIVTPFLVTYPPYPPPYPPTIMLTP